ncbi:hypothetical protein F53441_4398 [Fusarium austroafricanum]|uniref:Uncharacterized protein n=1 Tax=Fusarium austroafricanum TaxID=2364996 RepID=A0A8H4KND4_9HYPO|nr:hypothetical protein F53441_4398 [Fusarium austroafricanum]
MRHYNFLPFLASALVAPVLAGPGQSLDAICKSTEGTYGCDAYFKIPFGSEPITTCVNTSPCGVQILTNNRNICDLIQDAMGNDNFVVGYPAWCREAPRAIKEVKTERAVWVDGKLKGAKWVALATANSAEEEFDNRGFKVQSNKNTILANQLADKDGWVVQKAAEINTKSYFDLVDCLNSCDTSGCSESQVKAVTDWFLEWIPRGTEIRNGQMSKMLADWEKTFATPYKNRITAIKTAATTVQTRVKTVSTKVDDIKKSICQKNACTGKTASTYLNNVSGALKAVKDLQNIIAAANSADEKRKYIYYNYLGNIQASYNLDPQNLVPNNLNDLLDDGRFNTLGGIMHGFGTVASELSMYANDIKRNLTPLILLTKHESRSRDTLKKINAQLTQNWKNNAELSKTATSRKVRDGFIQIQGLLKKELQGSLTSLIDAIDAFDNDFQKFPLRGNKMEVTYGTASYDRWFNLEFKHPCRKEVTKTFTEAGFSKDHTWPVFSPCTFTAQKVDLPKGWIPYIKYRFVKV